MWLSFFACAILFLCILLNSQGYRDYKQYAKTALRVFTDTRRGHRVLRWLCLIGFILSLAAFVYVCFFTSFALQDSFALLALALLFALFAFVPYSSALWTLNEKGIYIYRIRRFIPWSQIIQTGVVKKRHTTYLTLQVKKGSGEAFKRVYYAVIVPAEEVEEVLSIIRDFLHALEQQRYFKARQEEKKVALKDRKWY